MTTAAGVSVAVIGGGISGLVCANRLTQCGIRNVTVYDTGTTVFSLSILKIEAHLQTFNF